MLTGDLVRVRTIEGTGDPALHRPQRPPLARGGRELARALPRGDRADARRDRERDQRALRRRRQGNARASRAGQGARGPGRVRGGGRRRARSGARQGLHGGRGASASTQVRRTPPRAAACIRARNSLEFGRERAEPRAEGHRRSALCRSPRRKSAPVVHGHAAAVADRPLQRRPRTGGLVAQRAGHGRGPQ